MAFKQVMCQHIYSQKSGKSGIFIQIWALEGKCRRYDIGPISETLEKRIRSETDLETLGVWLKKAARASTVEEFEQEIA